LYCDREYFKLESVQAEAARVVTEGTRLVSLLKLYAETGWEYLKDRREKHRLTYFYKKFSHNVDSGKGFLGNQVYVLTPISIIRYGKA
jgi:hypothetical protein